MLKHTTGSILDGFLSIFVINELVFVCLFVRPTMIRCGISNIRDLCGHKVNLEMVQSDPFCRLDK